MQNISAWKPSVAALSDDSLLQTTRRLAGNEREKSAWLVAHLAEVFRRDLALKRGFPSLFRYAREVLKLSDSQAWERVSAARLALQIPETIERLATGDLSLDSAGALWKTIREQEKPSGSSGRRKPLLKTEPRQMKMPDSLPPLSGLESSSGESAAESPKPLLMTEKREIFTRVLGKSRRESEATLQQWKQERTGEAPSIQLKTKPLNFELTDEERESFDRLRDLLSHRLGSRDPKAVLLWLMNQGLEKLDPIRQEARAKARQAAREKTKRGLHENSTASWSLEEMSAEAKPSRDSAQSDRSTQSSEPKPIRESTQVRKSIQVGKPTQSHEPSLRNGIAPTANMRQSPLVTKTARCDALHQTQHGAQGRARQTAPRQAQHTKLIQHNAPRRARHGALGHERRQEHRRTTIPAGLKRQVWIRDRGTCQYVDPATGRKCGAVAFLDFDHERPVSAGGTNTLANVRLLCSSHNRRRHRWRE